MLNTPMLFVCNSGTQVGILHSERKNGHKIGERVKPMLAGLVKRRNDLEAGLWSR